MIQTIELTKRVSRTFRLAAISLQVESGEISGLLGPNGSGKSTLIRCLAGVYRPDQGQIFVDGRDVTADAQKARRAVGVVTDRLLGYPWLTLREYLGFCGSLYGIDETATLRKASPLLERFDLAEHLHSTVSRLSNGMKQKLNFVRATLHDPRVLLLDEPTLGLDPPSVSVLSEYVEEFRASGGAVLLCTHDIGFVERISTSVLFLADGQILSRHWLADIPLSFAIAFSYDGDAQILGLMADQFAARGITLEPAGDRCHRVRYEAQQQDETHGWVLERLWKTGAHVLGFASDQVGVLERLYVAKNGGRGGG